jgi:sodium/hydrogen antiporter
MALQMDWALAIVALTLQLALYAVLSLTVVRMLRVAIAMLGTRARPPTLGFVGWFGPRGLASIVFAVIVVEESNLPHEHRQEGREAEAG